MRHPTQPPGRDVSHARVGKLPPAEGQDRAGPSRSTVWPQASRSSADTCAGAAAATLPDQVQANHFESVRDGAAEIVCDVRCRALWAQCQPAAAWEPGPHGDDQQRSSRLLATPGHVRDPPAHLSPLAQLADVGLRWSIKGTGHLLRLCNQSGSLRAPSRASGLTSTHPRSPGCSWRDVNERDCYDCVGGEYAPARAGIPRPTRISPPANPRRRALCYCCSEFTHPGRQGFAGHSPSNATTRAKAASPPWNFQGKTPRIRRRFWSSGALMSPPRFSMCMQFLSNSLLCVSW